MCSFLILPLHHYKKIKDLNKILEKLKLRGPDKINIIEYNNYVFIHCLLHFSGSVTYQPLIDSDKEIVLCFNGEIYNYKSLGNYSSDTESILDLYSKEGPDFVKKLNGEFTFVIFDFKKNLLIQSSDIFSTKPQWYYQDNNGIIISTFRSCIVDSLNWEPEFNDRDLTLPHNENDILKYDKISFLAPNYYHVKNISSLKVISSELVYKFDLEQKKDNYDDFSSALINAVKIRTTKNNSNDSNIGLCLSSGYDSGSIAKILQSNNVKYYSYTIEGYENLDILDERLKLEKNNKLYVMNEEDFKTTKTNFSNIVEGTSIKQYSTFDNIVSYYNLIGDWAGVGLYFIFEESKKDNVKIFLSGQGADEIFSDYGWQGYNIKDVYNPNPDRIRKTSSFYGNFTKNLEDIFPWPNFYNGMNQCFIAKEELTASLFGIETRYPFLDKDVVQEFLWLSHDLKNKYYKAPLHNFLVENNYPFACNEKVGFKAKKYVKSYQCEYCGEKFNKLSMLKEHNKLVHKKK